MIFVGPKLSWANRPIGHPAAPGQAFLYAYIDPLIVFKGDEQTTLTLEVATTGESIHAVELSRPIAAAMHDDGTDGDRLAADGIYTLDDIPHSTQYSILRHGGTHSPSGRLRVVIERADQTAEEYSLGIGIVAADQHFQPTRLGDGLYATRYAFFIVDPAGEVLGTADWPLGEVSYGRRERTVPSSFLAVISGFVRQGGSNLVRTRALDNRIRGVLRCAPPGAFRCSKSGSG